MVPPTSGKWHHLIIRFDGDKGYANVYIGGKHSADAAIDNAQPFNAELVFVSLGTSTKSTNCNLTSDDGQTMAVAFKEGYVWNRLLDDNDLPLLFGKEFIPYDPIIKWDDFKSHANENVVISEDEKL